MSAHTAAERRSRPGGRSERVVSDVLAATSAELARVGYLALRIEDVALRAGVAKTTVYRRWPTKPDLVAAALALLRGPDHELPDQGDVAADLVELARALLAKASTKESLGLHRVISLEIDNPEVERLAARLREDVRARWSVVVKRGVGRGELPASTDVGLVIDTVLAAITTRFLRQRKPVDLGYVRRVVDLVLGGARWAGERSRR